MTFRQEVVDHLSFDRWRATLEVLDAIEETWRAEGRRTWLLRRQARPSYGCLWAIFLDLEDEGFAEWRLRQEPPENLIGRGGKPRQEWRLKRGGKRVSAPLAFREATP